MAKKDAYYFSHDSNARADLKMRRARKDFGMVGYGVYFCILEIMREQKDYKILLSDIPTIADDLKVDEEIIDKIIRNYDLFTIEDALFYSNSFLERMKVYDATKSKLVEAGRRGGQAKARLKRGSSKALALKESISKGKDNKEKETKEQLFLIFWATYSKSVDKAKCMKKFLSLTDADIEYILQVLPKYIAQTPDKQYRKNPLTWLNGACWNDIPFAAPIVPKEPNPNDNW